MPISRGHRILVLPCRGGNPNIIFRDLSAGGRKFRFDMAIKVGGLFVGQQDNAAVAEFLNLSQGLRRLFGFMHSVNQFAQDHKRQVDVVDLIYPLVKAWVSAKIVDDDARIK